MARDKPQVSVRGLLGIKTVGKNSCRMMPKYGEYIKEKRKELRQRKENQGKGKDVAIKEGKIRIKKREGAG